MAQIYFVLIGICLSLSLTLGDISNIRINDQSPFWLGSNESLLAFPESAVFGDDAVESATVGGPVELSSDDSGILF